MAAFLRPPPIRRDVVRACSTSDARERRPHKSGCRSRAFAFTVFRLLPSLRLLRSRPGKAAAAPLRCLFGSLCAPGRRVAAADAAARGRKNDVAEPLFAATEKKQSITRRIIAF